MDLRLGTLATKLDAAGQTVSDNAGRSYKYGKLLLATGGDPRRLDINGGNIPGVIYYRTLADYQFLQPLARPGAKALVIGGGFIGSELSAGLNANQVDVTMIFPGPYLVSRVFPESLARSLTDHYRQKGVRILDNDIPVSIESTGNGFVTQTRGGEKISGGFCGGRSWNCAGDRTGAGSGAPDRERH